MHDAVAMYIEPTIDAAQFYVYRIGNQGPIFFLQITVKPAMLQLHAWYFVSSNFKHVAVVLRVLQLFE